MENEVAQKLVEETKKVNDARNELVRLQAEKEKFIEDREKEAELRLESIEHEIENSEKILDAWTKKVRVTGKELERRYAVFEKGLSSVLDKAEAVTEKSGALEKYLKNVEEQGEKTIGKLNELISNNSELGKRLKSKEKDLVTREQRLVRKLAKVEHAIFWHKKGGVVYNDKDL